MDENPPGIDGANDMEGIIPPGDRPRGADEWGTTAREEQLDEPLADRVRREQPDIETGDSDVALGRLVEPDQGMVGVDDEEDALGFMTGDDAGLSAEEAAMHETDAP